MESTTYSSRQPKTEGTLSDESRRIISKPEQSNLTKWQKYITTAILFYVMLGYVSIVFIHISC